MTTGLNNESTRMQLSYAICKTFTVAIEEDYTSYDAWEAIEDELQVTPEKVCSTLRDILDCKKTGCSFSIDSSVSDNLVKIDSWFRSFSVEDLELFYADMMEDLALIDYNRNLEQTFRDNLVTFYRSVLENTNTQDECIVCPVSKRQRRIIKKACGLDIKATGNCLTVQVIGHIAKRHGTHGISDRSFADSTKISQIVDVLMHSDSAELSLYASGDIRLNKHFLDAEGNFAKAIVFTKKMDDGHGCFVVEAMTDTKKGVLRIVTAYRGK